MEPSVVLSILIGPFSNLRSRGFAANVAAADVHVACHEPAAEELGPLQVGLPGRCSKEQAMTAQNHPGQPSCVNVMSEREREREREGGGETERETENQQRYHTRDENLPKASLPKASLPRLIRLTRDY